MAHEFVASPDHLGRLLAKRWGRDLPVVVHPQAFNYLPCGSRLLVVIDPAPEQWGGIIIPAQAKENEMLGIGTVISVGQSVGFQVPYPGGPHIQDPTELLYRRVVFGMYSGKTIRLDFIRDREFESNVLVLADRDIWCVLDEPEPAQTGEPT